MKKLLIAGLLLFPSISYADRLGSLKNNAEVLLSTQTAGGGYQLEPATVTIQAGQGITASTSVVTNGSSYSLIYNPETHGYQLIQDIPLAMTNEVGWGFDQNGVPTMRDTLWGDTGSLNSGYSIYLSSNATATGELPLRFRITRGGKIAFYDPNLSNPIVEFSPVGNSSFTIPVVASSITAYGTITSTSGFRGPLISSSIAIGGINVSSNVALGTIGLTIDGGGSAITTGSKGFIYVPYSCSISSWVVVADQSGSIVVDIKRSTWAGFPTTASIVGGGNKPTLSTVQRNSAAPASWDSTLIQAGDVIEFNVDSAATVTRINLSLVVLKL